MSTLNAPSLSLLTLTATFTLLFAAAATTLISLNCTPPPPGIMVGPSLARLLDRLTNQTETAHFASSSMAINRTNVTGLVQCQSDLSRTRCNECVRFAKRTVSTLCLNSESVTAWLDGCYVEASLVGFDQTGPTLAHSCPDQRPVHWAGLVSAFNTLLVRFTSGVAFGAIETISDGDNTIHGYVECIRTLSESECRSCVKTAVDNLNRSCRGRTKGYVVVRKCVARFEAFSSTLTSPPEAKEEGKCGGGRGRRAVLVCWGVVFACLVGFVWSVWFVQRSIVNRAKVCVMIDTDPIQDSR